MRLTRLLIIGVLCSTFFIACSKDDDNDQEVIPPRNPAEQALADDKTLVTFLETHFYNEEDFENPPEGFDYQVKFDTIDGVNAARTPIIDSDLLETYSFTRSDVEHKFYVLKIREGVGAKPTFADSAYVRYQGTFVNRVTFDANTKAPEWFDFPGYIRINAQGRPERTPPTIPGFVQAVVKFGEGSGYQTNSDNTTSWNDDFGIGAVFLPSGLGYYNTPPPQSGIPVYSPLIFSFNLMRTNEADHDRDGIPSWMEDIDNDGNLFNDDTDENEIPNHSDPDDDGDGTLTREEIIIKQDGTIIFPDANNNGIPKHLDPDDFDPLSDID